MPTPSVTQAGPSGVRPGAGLQVGFLGTWPPGCGEVWGRGSGASRAGPLGWSLRGGASGPPGRARPPHLLARPTEGRLGTRGKGGPELVHGGCRGAGPLRRQGALWGRWTTVRLGSVCAPPSVWPTPPHQHCRGVGSAGRCQMCRPPPWGAAAAPGPAASHPTGPGCPWTGRGRGQWCVGYRPRAGLNWGLHPGAWDLDPSPIPPSPSPFYS